MSLLFPRSTQRGAGAGGGGRGGWLQHGRALGWGPTQGTHAAAPVPTIASWHQRGPDPMGKNSIKAAQPGREDGQPSSPWQLGRERARDKHTRDKRSLGEAGWKGRLQAGNGNVGSEGCSPCAMSPCQPPSTIADYLAQRCQTGHRGHWQREGRLCPALTHEPGEPCWAEPPPVWAMRGGRSQEQLGRWQRFLPANAEAPGLPEHRLPPALHRPPNSTSCRTFANDDAAQCQWARALKDIF